MIIKIINTDECVDLSILKDRVFNPSLMIIAPFVPFLFITSFPASALFFVIPLLDFFSAPRKLCRKYIVNFERWYVSLFIVSLVSRVILEVVNIVYWSIPLVILPFVLVIWTKFAYQNWRALYSRAQLLS